MRFKDYALCSYSERELSYKNWNCPLYAIGWIEKRTFPIGGFSKGDVPEKVLSKLKEMGECAFEYFSGFRGLHTCSLCKENLDNSHVNFFIPAEGKVFVCPGRVDHYITAHDYCPPQEFINALLLCPDITTDEYMEKLKVSNTGKEPRC